MRQAALNALRKDWYKNPCSLTINLDKRGHLLRPESLVVADDIITLLIKRMDDVWKAREIEKKFRTYCLTSILELNKQIMALRLIEPDLGHVSEPEYDYTDECMEPAPAAIDGHGGFLNVSVPLP